MAVSLKLSNSLRTTLADTVDDAIDAGSSPGKILIYTSPQPASPNDTIGTATLLATLLFTAPSKGSVSTQGTMTFAAITSDTSADAAGTAVWARITTGSNTTLFDCNVGTSGCTMNMNTTAVTSGSQVSISSFTFTIPEGT